MSEQSTTFPSMHAADASVAVSMASSPSSFDDATTANFSVTKSIVSYLRMEADQAEDRAKRLRKQAAEIAEQFGITQESQRAYDLDPTELAPLDENGIPKYKGKKRGRKPKAKKRKMKPDRPKRKHTGYTLFMQEVYPTAKSECPDLASKELISLVAGRWKDLDIAEREMWKERASEGRIKEGPEAIGSTTSSSNNRGTIDPITNIAPIRPNDDSYPTSRTDDDRENSETESKSRDITDMAPRTLSKNDLGEIVNENVDDEDIDADSVVDENDRTSSHI
mmetsp:Transcript_11119/g.26720  ORF Transcript_11119/g.26720 Transcript_11119/m.26720 type:complete len:279 (+) Transcript_11119:154-990(+)